MWFMASRCWGFLSELCSEALGAQLRDRLSLAAMRHHSQDLKKLGKNISHILGSLLQCWSFKSKKCGSKGLTLDKSTKLFL